MGQYFFDANRLEFSHTAFNLLMQRRVYRVLLVCSNYDFFMLEEDGRIDEQIFNEYTSLNIRFPPVFIQADSAKKAFTLLEQGNIDLIILMLNIGDSEPFDLAKQIKNTYTQIPIVVLTHFSREVSLRLQNEDLSAIDYVFCWLGNADLLLAIIKLIEDRMNAEQDILNIGVQSILLVEDSVRYISQILPNIYKIVIRQSREFMMEGLNEHQKMLRLRGRPKILLAKTYDEALAIYKKYGHHLLGIISDISYKKSKKSLTETKEGIELCKLVRGEDPFMPFLIQSSDKSNEKHARASEVGFVHKLSKTLSMDLRDYIIHNFGFGELVFKDPDSGAEIARARDLVDLQHLILKIPDNVLIYHASKNEISKWLNARSLFSIGQLFKALRIEDFESLTHVRQYIYDAISSYRMSKGRGVIATYEPKNFDEYTTLCRIGDGSLGGKGRGLAFIDSIIKKHNLHYKFNNTILTIPRTVVISTDLFDEFMEINQLYGIALSEATDEEILDAFVKASLPGRLLNDLQSFIERVSKPIAVRSSSKLEDSYYQPFAGIYSTYMIPIVKGSVSETLQMLADAIKCVYASVFYKSSKTYITATSNVIDEEKMGIILEEVCGKPYGEIYFPAISGVARSVNFYPIKPEAPEDGIVNIAFGLGKYIVDGGQSLRFSPKYPQKIIQHSDPETTLRESQKQFYALSLNPEHWKPSVDDKINLVKLKTKEAEHTGIFKSISSTYDLESQRIIDGIYAQGKKVVTFSSILNHNQFPLAEILKELLEIGQREMNNPIEIEFAVDLDVPMGTPRVFNFLQIRPIVESDQSDKVEIEVNDADKAIVFSNAALGNGNFRDIYDFVYIKPDVFKSSATSKIVTEVEKINEMMLAEKRNYVLAGPGRWGSGDAWLGIPVKWGQITEARIIIEAGQSNFHVDPSQGTHFFQNLTSFRVGYMTVNPHIKDGIYNIDFLNTLTAIYESEFVRVVRFESPITIMIDGTKNKGIILKPVILENL